MDDAWKDGLAFRIAASSSSVSPLTLPKMGVNRPGVWVVPLPETYTKLKGCFSEPRVLKASAALRAKSLVILTYSLCIY